MALLTLIKNNKKLLIPFDGAPLLKDMLVNAGCYIDSPCGGNGKCLKCAIKVQGNISEPNSTETKAGCRLACQTVLYGDTTVELLFPEESFDKIQTSTTAVKTRGEGWKYGVAADVGTTTVVLKLFSADGSVLGEETALNPQRSVSSDVIGRIGEALKGEGSILQQQISDCLIKMLNDACTKVGIHNTDVDRMIITGNTAMMYLLTGKDPSSVSCAPFEADNLFGVWTELFGIKTYLAPCIDAFVGGDLTCAVLESGMCEKSETSLLCDIGTNGEIALWKNGVLYVTSTAAGPAFEGADISCGCGSVPGAVYRVWAEEGRVYAHTICNLPAVGICGSGLIDAVAAFLENGVVDRTGRIIGNTSVTANGGTVTLLPDDIRALQLAKAAVAAGIWMLLSRSQTDVDEIKTLYLAGGFGNKLDPYSAARIGLVPSILAKRTGHIGNGALSGAVKMLFDDGVISCGERIAKNAVHIELGGNEEFNEAFIDNLFFT